MDYRMKSGDRVDEAILFGFASMTFENRRESVHFSKKPRTSAQLHLGIDLVVSV